MRCNRVSGLVLSLIVVVAVGRWVARTEAAEAGQRAELGKPVKALQLQDVKSGKPVKLTRYRDKVLVLMWYSPECLASPSYDQRLKEFARAHLDAKTKMFKKVALLAIGSNSGDSAAALRDYAKSAKFNFPVMRDDGAAAARYFNVQYTATCLIIDARGVLRYHGGFDDNTNADLVKRQHVKDAVKAILAGKQVPRKSTEPPG